MTVFMASLLLPALVLGTMFGIWWGKRQEAKKNVGTVRIKLRSVSLVPMGQGTGSIAASAGTHSGGGAGVYASMKVDADMKRVAQAYKKQGHASREDLRKKNGL